MKKVMMPQRPIMMWALVGLLGLKSPLEAEHGFSRVVRPFLHQHCVDCHGDDDPKAELSLENIELDFKSEASMEQWEALYRRIALGTMPPKKQPRPEEKERREVTGWIRRQIMNATHGRDVRLELLGAPYGNYVDHATLFSGEIVTPPFSPPRLWRMNPNIYDGIREAVFSDPWEARDQARQALGIESREGILDYAAVLHADSATLETLLRNARLMVDFQLNHRGPRAFRMVLESPKPDDTLLMAAIAAQFRTMVSRDPNEGEQKRYLKLIKTSIAKAGVEEGLKVGLKAIVLSTEAIYRMELGLSTKDEHGRSILAPMELAFAIAYALTDTKPDALLWDAACNGGLEQRADIKAQINRILNDEETEKPRILRFFREFFGYHQAGLIFKDEERYDGFFYGDVAEQLIHEADLLVNYVVERDQDVLKELLTTEAFFVGHVGDASAEFETQMKEKLIALRLFYEDRKDKVWKGIDYELAEGVKKSIMALHPYFRGDYTAHRINGDMIKMYMPYLGMCYQKGIRPMLAEHVRMGPKGLGHERNLTFSNGHRQFVKAYNLEIETFDCPTKQPFVIQEGRRAGILTHPAWLVAHSKNTTTNPITRGKWIRERLLAGVVPDVPMDVNAVVPEDPHKTLRQRFEVTREERCWSCHQKMNPLGMAFEMYDDFGRWRSKEENGLTIDSSGFLDSTGDSNLDGEVRDGIELVERLAESDIARQSFVRYAFRYWMGRNEMLSDSRTLIDADSAYVNNDGSFRALLVSLLMSDSFLYRKQFEE
jgi:hypothetical protein